MMITWEDHAHAINGQVGHHSDLANWVELKGFEVEPDTDDNEVSFIARTGPEDFDCRIIGRIVGDSEATVIINKEYA